jgi:hypothetical protein
MIREMPWPVDGPRLWGMVAQLPCQRRGCGRHGVQVSHSNQSRDGKGGSLKAYPWMVAALCPACHVELDSGSNLSQEERFAEWDHAHIMTFSHLFAFGWLRPVQKASPHLPSGFKLQ